MMCMFSLACFHEGRASFILALSPLALFNGSHHGGTCLETGLNARLDELEKAGSLFTHQKSTRLEKMCYDPILDRLLELLNFLLLLFNRSLIGGYHLQKLDEPDLPLFDLLPQLLELGVEFVMCNTELLKLVGCQAELKVERHIWSWRLTHSGK